MPWVEPAEQAVVGRPCPRSTARTRATTGASNGASRRPCAAPIACASPVVRSTGDPADPRRATTRRTIRTGGAPGAAWTCRDRAADLTTGHVVRDRAPVDEPRDDQRDPEHRERDHAGAPRARERRASATDHQVRHAAGSTRRSRSSMHVADGCAQISALTDLGVVASLRDDRLVDVRIHSVDDA